jgi:hypothetical protein
MEVVNLFDRSESKRKAELLEILDELRSRVEKGEVDEFVAASIDPDGDVQIHACVKDIAGGVGLFEIGKHILITQQA